MAGKFKEELEKLLSENDAAKLALEKEFAQRQDERNRLNNSFVQMREQVILPALNEILAVLKERNIVSSIEKSPDAMSNGFYRSTGPATIRWKQDGSAPSQVSFGLSPESDQVMVEAQQAHGSTYTSLRLGAINLSALTADGVQEKVMIVLRETLAPKR